MSSARQWLGSILFTISMFVTLPFYALFVFVCAFARYETRFAAARWWVGSMLWLIERLCGLGYVVEGYENLPEKNCVILMKHSSSWETLAQIRIFPKQTWVLKRELMWAPFLGWALWFFKPIAIDRRAGNSAVQQVIEQGKERLAEGFWVMVFPEGTRVPAGQSKRYGLGGALLASAAEVPIVPVAHNAGDFWPRRGWLKRPGTVRVVIGPQIETRDRDPRDINDEARAFIEATIARISSGAAHEDGSAG